MKARLYIKTPWIFKHVENVTIPYVAPIIRMPSKVPVKVSKELVIGLPSWNLVEFHLRSHDKVNDEYIYISNQ